MTRDPDLEGWMLGELTGVPGISTRPMFGGLGIMRGGNLIAGVRAGRLMLRLGPAGADEALALAGVTPMVHGGRRMRGYTRSAWATASLARTALSRRLRWARSCTSRSIS